jgi:hypothetical protein
LAFSFYPKRLLATAVFIIAFGSVLSVATDLRRGVAVGILAVMAYLFVEVLIVFNPVVWWQQRRSRQT